MGGACWRKNKTRKRGQGSLWGSGNQPIGESLTPLLTPLPLLPPSYHPPSLPIPLSLTPPPPQNVAFRWSASGAPRLEIEILSCRALRVCPSYARPASAYYEQKGGSLGGSYGVGPSSVHSNPLSHSFICVSPALFTLISYIHSSLHSHHSPHPHSSSCSSPSSSTTSTSTSSSTSSSPPPPPPPPPPPLAPAMEMDLHHLRSRASTAAGPGLGPGAGHGQGLGARHGASRAHPPSPRLGAARCR